MRGNRVVLTQTPDDIYVCRGESGRVLASFYAENDGWWTVFLPNGTTRRLYEPSGDEREVARRLLSGP
ncbi:hypothetical protein GCM10009678_40190 [Actinomadura kijaniata]|uniref:Uncharacterized protein n=1 Tax=Actinomadura namibiensis TaxID=182080 RepID=A0A7W3QPD2_ACTNM|nr:hypothetical protein [Actinomadura namibiensis]MBA8954476.1 hypothetical protein [Actinomadura namibiensis]